MILEHALKGSLDMVLGEEGELDKGDKLEEDLREIFLAAFLVAPMDQGVKQQFLRVETEAFQGEDLMDLFGAQKHEKILTNELVESALQGSEDLEFEVRISVLLGHVPDLEERPKIARLELATQEFETALDQLLVLDLEIFANVNVLEDVVLVHQDLSRVHVVHDVSNVRGRNIFHLDLIQTGLNKVHVRIGQSPEIGRIQAQNEFVGGDFHALDIEDDVHMLTLETSLVQLAATITAQFHLMVAGAGHHHEPRLIHNNRERNDSRSRFFKSSHSQELSQFRINCFSKKVALNESG